MNQTTARKRAAKERLAAEKRIQELYSSFSSVSDDSETLLKSDSESKEGS